MKRLVMLSLAALFLASPAAKAEGLTTRTYAVEDLAKAPEDLRRLTGVIAASVAPDTWKRDDGRGGYIDEPDRVGTMTPFFLQKSLNVRTTPEVHRLVAEKLRQLRGER